MCSVILGVVSGTTGCSREPDITECAIGPIIVSDAAGVDKLNVPCVQGDVEIKGHAAVAAWSTREQKPRFITGKLKLSLFVNGRGEGASLSLTNLRRADIEVLSAAPVVIDAPEFVEGSVAGNAPITLRAPVFARGTALRVVDATLPALTVLERLEVARAPFGAPQKVSISLPALTSVKIVTVDGDATVDLGAALPTETVEVTAADISGLSFLPKLESVKRSLVLRLAAPVGLSLPELREVGEVKIDGASSVAFDQLERAGDVQANGLVTFDAPRLVRAGDFVIYGKTLTRLHLPALRLVGTLTIGAPGLTELALPSLEMVRGEGLTLTGTGLTALDLPALTTVSKSLSLVQNEKLAALSVPALIFSHQIVIRGSPALSVPTDHLRGALAPGAELSVCDTAGAPPCAWTPVGTPFKPFQTATGSENLRRSLTAGMFDSTEAILSALPKAPHRQIVGTGGGFFAAVLASATGVPTVMASGVLDIVSSAPKLVRTWAVPPLPATPTTLFLPFYSASASLDPRAAEPPPVALLVVDADPSKVRPTTFALLTLVKDRLVRAGSGQITTEQAARAGFFGFGSETRIEVQMDEEPGKQPVMHIVHTRDSRKLPLVFTRSGTSFVLEESLLPPLPPARVVPRWVAAAAALPPPEASPEQTDAAATTPLGACRIALPLAACPEGSITHTTRTETFCTLREGANAPRVGRALKYEESDCAEMASATTNPFVRVLESGSYENGAPTGTWFSWQQTRSGVFFLSSARQYRNGQLHGSVVNCSSDGACTTRRFFNDASVDSAQ